MDIFNVSVGIAFLAGLASFLSPCVLSLVPAYIGYLGGRAAGGEANTKNRWITFSHGFAFVIGFTFVFLLFNIIASALGGLLFEIRTWISRVGGIIIIIFGLHMIGIFRLHFLEYDIRVHSSVNQKMGYFSSALMGIFFSAGWSPCVGPVLGAIITLSANGGNIGLGILLGLAYSAGLAIPFLVAALGIGWVTTLLKKYAKVMRYVEIFMGFLLVLIGVLLVTGKFALLAANGLGVNFGL